MFSDLQPHNFIDSQSIGGAGILVLNAGNGNGYFTAIAHMHIAFAVVPHAFSTTLPTAFHATVVITDITIATTAQQALSLIHFVGPAGAAARRGDSSVGKRVCMIGIAGVVKATIGVTGGVVDKFEVIAISDFHYFFYQRLIFLYIPLHFS